MASVGSGQGVNIVAQFDRTDSSDTNSGYSADYGDWANTRRGAIMSGDAPTESWGESLGEKNMGHLLTLTDFIGWASGAYPAERYALILWDHGEGRRGACWDEQDGDDHLEIAEIGSALDATDLPLDLLAYDCCLMGTVECAYEAAPYASVLVASEQEVPEQGFPYDTILADLQAHPEWTAEQLGQDILTRYAESYDGAETISAIDLTSITELAGALDGLATDILDASDSVDRDALQRHRSGSAYFAEEYERDLGTFLTGVAGDADMLANIRSAAQTALDAYNDAVLSVHSGPGQNATGLTVFFPNRDEPPPQDYDERDLKFAADTAWDEFVAWWATGSLPVEDDHGDNAAQATAVSVGAWTDGGLGEAGDSDWFSFQAAAGKTCTIRVELTGLSDSYLRLYDSPYATDTSTPIEENDDHQGLASAIVDWSAPTSGAYYFSVRHYIDANTGPYRVQVEGAAPECLYDIDGNGFVGTGDYSYLSAAWHSQEGDTNWDLSADFDGDGYVGSSDYSYFSAAWHKDADDPTLVYPQAPSAPASPLFRAQARVSPGSIRSLLPGPQPRLRAPAEIESLTPFRFSIGPAIRSATGPVVSLDARPRARPRLSRIHALFDLSRMVRQRVDGEART